MNKNIKDKVLTPGNGEEGKKHQAFAMELSRLKSAQEDCLNNKNCSEYNRLGGDFRLNQINPVVEVPRKADEFKRKTQKDTNPNNTFQDEKSPTQVDTPDVSKKAQHGTTANKILSNKDLNEEIQKEISEIRYLIEYMNNNKKLI